MDKKKDQPAAAASPEGSTDAAADATSAPARAKREHPAGPQRPSTGRVVHFVMPDGKHRPAAVLDAHEGGVCDLFVMLGARDRSAVKHPEGVAEDPAGTTPGTWHWPERV